MKLLIWISAPPCYRYLYNIPFWNAYGNHKLMSDQKHNIIAIKTKFVPTVLYLIMKCVQNRNIPLIWCLIIRGRGKFKCKGCRKIALTKDTTRNLFICNFVKQLYFDHYSFLDSSQESLWVFKIFYFETKLFISASFVYALRLYAIA